MNDLNVFEQLLFIGGIATTLFCVPYLIRLGWGKAENRTKKVCNICFRDISQINKQYQELIEKKNEH